MVRCRVFYFFCWCGVSWLFVARACDAQLDRQGVGWIKSARRCVLVMCLRMCVCVCVPPPLCGPVEYTMILWPPKYPIYNVCLEERSAATWRDKAINRIACIVNQIPH